MTVTQDKDKRREWRVKTEENEHMKTRGFGRSPCDQKLVSIRLSHVGAFW